MIPMHRFTASRLGGAAHIPAIDGMRALAVLLVIFYHAQVQAASAGYAGVDVFFVISGFVVTQLIHRDLDAGRFSLRGFYARRARRLLPAMLVMVACVTPLVLWRYSPYGLANYGLGLWSMLLGFENIVLWQQATAYFGRFTASWPLLHGWSLSVEMQFYLLFPLFVLALKRWVSPAWQLRMVALLGLASFALFAWWMLYPATLMHGFYLLPARAWELLWGAYLAWPTRNVRLWGRWHDQLQGWMALFWALVALWLGMRFGRHSFSLFPVMVMACLAAALLLDMVAQKRAHPLLSLLGSPAFVFIGVMSYSLYLWHWPLLALSHTFAWEGSMRWMPRIFAIQGAFFCGYVSWRYLELPLRYRVERVEETQELQQAQAADLLVQQWGFHCLADGLRWRVSERGLVRALAMACVLCSVLGAGIWSLNGITPFTEPFAKLMTQTRFEVNRLQPWCNYSGMDEEHPLLQECLTGAMARDGRYSMLVWGDSQADQYVPALAAVAAQEGITLRQMSKNGCPPLIVEDTVENDSCNDFNKKVVAQIKENQDLRTVVLAAHWERHTDSYYHYVDGSSGQEIGLKEALLRTVEFLRKQGLEPIVMAQIPSFERTAQMERCFEYLTRKNDASYCLNDENRRDTQQADAVMQAVRVSTPVYDPTEVFCPRGVCQVYDPQGFYYHDASHLSVYGAQKLLPTLQPQMSHFLHSQTQK